MAQTYDLLTNTEARQIVGVGGLDATKDELLAQYVSGVSNKLAECVGSIVAGTVVDSFDGGCTHVWLRAPIYGTLTYVVEYDSTTAGTLTVETNASKPDAGYLVDTESGRLTRRSGNADSRFPVGRDNVVVSYTVGRCASTATVPERFKMAAGIMLKNAWRTVERGTINNGEYDVPQASFPTFAVPNAVKQLLADEWQVGSGIGD
jgi:hypothetical protein